MKKAKKSVTLWSIAGVVLAMLTLVTIVFGISSTPKVLMDAQIVIDAAEQTLECVRTGDYDALAQMLYGKPNLGESPEKTDDPQSIILDAYLNSIQYQLDTECYASGSGVALNAHIQCLDISALSTSLQASVPDLMLQIAQGKEEAEIYDEAHNYQSAFISEVLRTASLQALSEEPQMMERDITLTFARSNGKWLVVPTEDFVQLLSGYVSE